MYASEAASWHAILICIAVTLVANIFVGLLKHSKFHVGVSLVQAFTYTILLIMPELTAAQPDGQAAIAIPFFLFTFSVIAWIGLAIRSRWRLRDVSARSG